MLCKTYIYLLTWKIFHTNIVKTLLHGNSPTQLWSRKPIHCRNECCDLITSTICCLLRIQQCSVMKLFACLRKPGMLYDPLSECRVIHFCMRTASFLLSLSSSYFSSALAKSVGVRALLIALLNAPWVPFWACDIEIAFQNVFNAYTISKRENILEKIKIKIVLSRVTQTC